MFFYKALNIQKNINYTHIIKKSNLLCNIYFFLILTIFVLIFS